MPRDRYGCRNGSASKAVAVPHLRLIGHPHPSPRHGPQPGPSDQYHTAVGDRYVIEGHVPADDIKKFLAEKSTAHALAVPGMPIGSPGMEGARAERYNVLAFERNGTTRVYAKR